MNLFERLKATLTPRQYVAESGSTIDVHHLNPQQVADAVKHRPRGQAFIRPNVWTEETEKDWQEKVFVGKIARSIITLAKNTMASDLKSDNPELQLLCNIMSRKVHLQTQLQKACVYYLKYGQVYIYPVYADESHRDLVRLKILYSPSVKVYRDSAADIKELGTVLESAQLPKINATAGTGDEVIGYVQKLNDATWFFKPDEIIMVARYPDGERPNGYSILVQNADIISSKLQIEVDQTIMSSRHADPKIIWKVPASWYEEPNSDKLAAFKDDMRRGIRAGTDFYIPHSDNPDETVDVSLLEATGNPQAVIRTQEHAENQFIAAFGLADSFTESTSSNRSVGEIQLSFFERDIGAERILWCEILEDELINPWLIANGFTAGSAWLEFADLTPDDALQKLQILAPQFPYLPPSIVKQTLEQVGYIVDEDELDGGGDQLLPMMGAYTLNRVGAHATYSRLRGIPKKEADLIRYGRNAITEAAETYRNTVKEQFAKK